MIDFTTASRDDIKRCYDAIAAELGDDRFFTTKELDVLPKILAMQEQILSFSSGLMDGNTWLIVLTDRRVLFVDKGMIFGLKQTSMPLESIVTIDGETGLIFGTIRISTAAGPREIRNVWKRTVNPFINKVDEAMRARREEKQLLSPGSSNQTPQPAPQPHSPQAAPWPSTPPSATDIAPQASKAATDAEIGRLDRLLRSGAIDAAEYERQKSRLI